MKTFTIKPKIKARKWVKERLKRHPGSFVKKSEIESAVCWQGELSIFLKNVVDDWSGWFPIDDIEIIEDKQ